MPERLKRFLNDVLDGKNLLINEIFENLNSKNQLQMKIKDLNLTEHSFEPGLKTIATTFLHNSKSNGHIASLLIFSMEMDSFHYLNSSWYRRDMLIETLHSVLSEFNYELNNKEELSFWEYTIILFLCSIVLILFVN